MHSTNILAQRATVTDRGIDDCYGSAIAFSGVNLDEVQLGRSAERVLACEAPPRTDVDFSSQLCCHRVVLTVWVRNDGTQERIRQRPTDGDRLRQLWMPSSQRSREFL
jgi:hypothetical protein